MYQLRKPTLGILKEGKKPVIVTVPTDAVLQLDDKGQADTMVEVVWNQQRIAMFRIDLRERGDMVTPGQASGAHGR